MKLVWPKTNHRGHGEEIYLQGITKMLIPSAIKFLDRKEGPPRVVILALLYLLQGERLLLQGPYL
jgi:hypothetical protein